MKNKTDKEIQSFLQLFSDKSAEPNLEYKYKLKKNFLKEYNKKLLPQWPTFFGFRLSFLAFFSAALLVGIFAFSFLPGRNNNIEVSLNSGKKQEVLENVIKNNNVNVLRQVEESVRNPLNNEQVIAQAIELNSNQETNHFSQNKVLMTTGEKYEQCVVDSDPVTETDYYSYSDSVNSYSKIISLNSEGELIRYILKKTTAGKTEVIFYEGGENAVRVISNQIEKPVSYPSSFPVSYAEENAYSEWFEDNTEVVSTLINGTEYYVIQSEIENGCEDSNQSSYLNFVINSKTFEIERTESYLGQRSESNLIYSITKSDKTTNEFTDNEIEDIFTFDYEVEINDLNLKDLQNYFEQNGSVKGITSYPVNIKD